MTSAKMKAFYHSFKFLVISPKPLGWLRIGTPLIIELNDLICNQRAKLKACGSREGLFPQRIFEKQDRII